MDLLTVDNTKTVKGESLGYLTAILHLAPSTESGVMDVCTSSTVECRKACLNRSGRALIFPSIQRARIERTRFLARDRAGFLAQLRREITALGRRAQRDGLTLAVRINGTSDLPWLARLMAREFPHVQFYDYTKHRKPWLRVMSNYDLTFSHSGHNLRECLEALRHGVNVSVVFSVKRGAPLPEVWNGWRVIDGDLSDVRFLDPRGVVVGLRAKGVAVGTVSPFVVLP